MFEVRLDLYYFSHSQYIFEHLKEMFGRDKYEYTPWEGMPEGESYYIQQVSGYTTVKFQEESKAKEFREWVDRTFN